MTSRPSPGPSKAPEIHDRLDRKAAMEKLRGAFPMRANDPEQHMFSDQKGYTYRVEVGVIDGVYRAKVYAIDKAGNTNRGLDFQKRASDHLVFATTIHRLPNFTKYGTGKAGVIGGARDAIKRT